MAVLNVIVSALIPIVGGLAAATMLCVGCWQMMTRVRHPEFGPVLGLGAIAVLLLAGVRAGQLLAMAGFFLLIPAVLLWPEGKRWRQRHPDR